MSLVPFKTGFIFFVVVILSRFGKKKEDKSKASKNKLEALSEEELERIPNTTDGYESSGNSFVGAVFENKLKDSLNTF